MSDVMLFGVLHMSYDMAMATDTSRYQYWQRGKEAAARIEALEGSLAKYSCGCPYPCALYDAEKAKEDEMPHMMCGWWAKSVLENTK